MHDKFFFPHPLCVYVCGSVLCCAFLIKSFIAFPNQYPPPPPPPLCLRDTLLTDGLSFFLFLQTQTVEWNSIAFGFVVAGAGLGFNTRKRTPL